ncbi:MAG: hypothetical protein LIP04_10570 [Tannerellaceae bacterium]|nr:hypothetical protein [Tannerellaceae bacterium]
MKKAILLLIGLITIVSVSAQRKDFSYKFYGFVRGDLFFNSRENVEVMDGIFYLYPSDKVEDANGEDLNANPNASFYSFTTRLGLEATGPQLGTAKASAKIEADFAGYSSATYLFRIRHAYVKFDWEKGSSLLLGQTWHPLFGDFYPDVNNLSPGTPFQPFNRSPQIRYTYRGNKFDLSASAIYQLMSLSGGPDGKTTSYLKNSVLPELYAGANYIHDGLIVGAGIELLSIKPRTQSTINDKTYKVNERLTTLSYTAQAKYEKGDFAIAGKTVVGSNLQHLTMPGGFGVTSIDPVNGKQDYTSTQHSTSWLNIVYGNRWKGGVMAGYSKNLGTFDPLVSTEKFYGSGLNIDQMSTGMFSFSYNLLHWKAGIEYSITTAWYGDIESCTGKVKNTHAVTNHRLLWMFCYLF